MTTLDQKTVAALDAESAGRIVFDTDLKGFGVRVRYDSKGRLCKAWCVQYRHEGKQRRQNIGKFPRMNAATARTKAGAWLNKVHDGIDPAGERAAQIKVDALKFHKAVEQYLAKRQAEVRGSTFHTIKLYLTGRYFEPLHNKSLAKIAQSDVEQCLDAITQKPTRWAAQKSLSAFYVWAVRKGHAPENPLVRVDQVKLASRERVLSEDEIRKVWNACQNDDLGKIIKLLLLTGCRADEIGGLKWSEIDADKATIKLSAERTKNGREHILPLSPLALQIVKQIEKRPGRDFLFGKTAAGGFVWWAKRKTLVNGLAHWTIHDLRRTAATHMAELGIEPHIIEAILNHVSGHKTGVAGIYNRASYGKQMRIALDRWAVHIEGIVTGRASNLVPFPASA